MNDATSDGMEKVFEGCGGRRATFAAAPLVRPIDFSAPNGVHYTRDMLYDNTRPENVRHASSVSRSAFRASLAFDTGARMASKPTWRFCQETSFFGVSEPSLATDPVLLDAAGQLVGYWVAESFGIESEFFPFAAEDYRQYATPFPGRFSVDLSAQGSGS